MQVRSAKFQTLELCHRTFRALAVAKDRWIDVTANIKVAVDETAQSDQGSDTIFILTGQDRNFARRRFLKCLARNRLELQRARKTGPCNNVATPGEDDRFRLLTNAGQHIDSVNQSLLDGL